MYLSYILCIITIFFWADCVLTYFESTKNIPDPQKILLYGKITISFLQSLGILFAAEVLNFFGHLLRNFQEISNHTYDISTAISNLSQHTAIEEGTKHTDRIIKPEQDLNGMFADLAKKKNYNLTKDKEHPQQPATYVGSPATAFFSAINNNNLNLIKRLIQEGLDINIQNEDGRSGIHVACEIGNIEALKLLLDSGSDLNLVDNFGTSALMAAISNNRLESVIVLLNMGANVNTQRNDGSTALHITATTGSIETAKLLIQYGAQTCIADRDNNTPRQVAKLFSNDGIVQLIDNLTG